MKDLSLQKGLKLAYEVKYRMQQKLQQMIRHWFLYRVGVLKYRWDKDKGFITEPVLPKKIGMDKRATSRDNCEYVYEEMEDTLVEVRSSSVKVLADRKTAKRRIQQLQKNVETWEEHVNVYRKNTRLRGEGLVDRNRYKK